MVWDRLCTEVHGTPIRYEPNVHKPRIFLTFQIDLRIRGEIRLIKLMKLTSLHDSRQQHMKLKFG